MKDNKKTDFFLKNDVRSLSEEFKQASKPKQTLNFLSILTLGFTSLFFYLLISLVFLGKIDGLDPENFEHWVKTIFEFSSSPLDISVLSPFQGMGGLCQPIATRIHLPFLMGFIFSPDDPRGVITIVSAILFATATAFFCYTFIKKIFLSIVAGQFLAIFFFPPIWTFLLPWSHFFTTALFSFLPATSYPVTLGIVFLGLFQTLGRGSNLQNAVITFALGLTFLYATLVDPLYTAMFWIPVAIFCTGILIGGETRRIWTWRLCGAFACFFILWFLGIFKFYYALFGNAARSVFPNELYVEIQKWDNLTGLFSYGGGAIIFSILILASCIFLFFNSPRQLRYFSLAVGTYFCAMVAVSLVYVYSGMRWNLPLPVYLEVGAAPAYAIIVILATHRAINLYFKNTKLAFQRIPQIAFVIFLPLFSASILGFIFILNPDLTKKPSILASKESNGLVSKILAPNISIGPDGLFRGSVAMVAAVPGGEIMRRAGIPSETPFQKDHILFLSRYLRSYDPHLYMTGLWEMRIPTLEDNSHLVTPPFYFLFSRALCRKQDFQSRNWTLCTSVQPNLMAALGARFLVSDLVIESPLLNKVATQSNSDGIPLYVYEFLKPNLANYSPTQCLELDDAKKILDLIQTTDFPFTEKAIVAPKSQIPPLVKAERSELFYERGGFRIRAASKGWSLIVLPVQFSNSLQIIESLVSDKLLSPRLIRVNLLQTGVLFHGNIHIKVAHVFGPFRNVEGRIQDIKDWKNLGVKEDATILYPPNFQPLAF